MAHCATQTDEFELCLDATPLAVSHARAAFETWLRDVGAVGETADELGVVFSELVANAVQASLGAGEVIEVAAWSESGSVIILCVANPITSVSAPVTAHDLADPMRTGGRGLLIVRAFTDTMSVEFDDESIVIRCERRIDA